MRKLGLYPRLSYALVVVVSVVFASLVAIEIAVGLAAAYPVAHQARSDLYILGLLLSFLFPGGRALIRVARRHPLLSVADSDLKRYMVTVTVLGSIGHLLALNVGVAYYEILVEDKEASGIGFGAALAGICYLMALWIGEFVVMKNTNRVTTEPSGVPESPKD